MHGGTKQVRTLVAQGIRQAHWTDDRSGVAAGVYPDDSDEPWGDQLRRWRDEVQRWTQQDLVDQVIRLAFTTNEERGTKLDIRLVGRWETGAVQRPQAVYRRLLDQLGAPVPSARRAPTVTRPATGMPGGCPAPADPVSLASMTSDRDSDGWDGDSSVLRRDFLRASGSLALSGLLGSVLGNTSSSTATIEVATDLTNRLTSLRRLDDTLGGADTYKLYNAEAELSARILQGGTARDAVHRALLAVHAEQSQQAGWAAFDAGWHDLAREHFRRSHAAALESGDPGLAGNALAFHAYQLIALGEPARSISEKSVQTAGEEGVDPGVRALLYSRAAWTFALDGDADTTARCLGLAEEAYAVADARTPDYAAWIDADELAIMTGRCWSELRRPLRAVPVLESALARYSDVHARDKALYSSWLAQSYADAGEVEQAAETVTTSLHVMGNVASVRPRQRLTEVAERLGQQHSDVPAVQELLRGDALHPIDVRR